MVAMEVSGPQLREAREEPAAMVSLPETEQEILEGCVLPLNSKWLTAVQLERLPMYMGLSTKDPWRI